MAPAFIGHQTGDGGFQLNVTGNTDLKGGILASIDAAIQIGKNSLATATLTKSDIQNWDTISCRTSGAGFAQLKSEPPEAPNSRSEAVTVPAKHAMWVNALRIDRPIDVNVDTRLLGQRLTEDPDLAAVVWALHRESATKWLDLNLPGLGGQRPADLIGTEEGRRKLWDLLEQSTAWL